MLIKVSQGLLNYNKQSFSMKKSNAKLEAGEHQE
jgi:hypothetical protein